MHRAQSMISDPAAVMVCSAGGVPTVRGKIFELEKLALSIQANIRETEAAQTKADLIKYTLFGLQLIKATCDGAVAVLGVMTGPVGSAISTSYSALTPVAEMGGKALSGQRIGAGEVIKSTTGLLAGGFGVTLPNSAYGGLVKLNKVKGDIVVDAFHQDSEALLIDLGSYQAELGSMALEAAGKPKMAGAVGAAWQIVQSGLAYAKAYDDFKADNTSEALDVSKRLAVSQQQQIQARIGRLKSAISACEVQLAGGQLR